MELKEPTATISHLLDNKLIGEAAREASMHYEFPVQTSSLITLGLVSHVVQLAFCSKFKTYRELPCGLYVVSEQGKAASKSPLFDAIKGDADDYLSEWNRKIIKERNQAIKELAQRGSKQGPGDEMLDEDSNKNPLHLFVTNPTPEALEYTAGKQGGVFSVASTEKTVLSVLFGNAYGDASAGSTNLELPLSGFVGEKPKVLRIKREGILTRASGAITILSQPGTVQTILAASSNTGLSERFLMLIEPRITKKDLQDMWSKGTPNGKPHLDLLEKVMRKIIDIAKNQKTLEIQDRQALTFSKESTDFIEEYRRDCKMRGFDEDSPFSNELIVGYLLKSDMQIMKMATVIHVIESLISGNTVPKVIKHEYVLTAFQVVRSLVKGVPIICEESGLIGDNSLSEVIENYLRGKGRKDAKSIYNSVRKNEKFLAIPTKLRKDKFDKALKDAVNNGAVRLSPLPFQGKILEVYSV
ncbi:DNA helicase [Vibrio phage K394]